LATPSCLTPPIIRIPPPPSCLPCPNMRQLGGVRGVASPPLYPLQVASYFGVGNLEGKG